MSDTESTTRQIIGALTRLQAADPAPVYLQIERAMRRLVADGTLKAGQRLPSVRALAQQLGLAANTVARAYTDLAGEGVILARAGGGSVVARPRQGTASGVGDEPRERLQRVARHLVAYSLALGHGPGEVVHAVRAELAALGRLEAAQADPSFEILAGLPTHAVPSEARASVNGDSPHDLRVDGLVASPSCLTLADLERLRRASLRQPFACDEGWVVPDLRWGGVWLADVLAMAGPLPAAQYVRVGAGAYTTTLALAETSDALLADELDAQPLALEHGAPWRLVLPGGACYTSVKWVDSLELLATPGARSDRI